MFIFTRLADRPDGVVAQRVVSLVPSITELLFDLGLGDRVAGITKFCIRPEHWYRTKTRIGGTKQIDVKRIKLLKPDLIIASREENVEAQVLELARSIPVFLTDIKTLDDALRMIEDVGILTGTSDAAAFITGGIRQGFSALPVLKKTLRALYLIWRQPLMAAGADTFIHHMMRTIGLENVLGECIRYPEIGPVKFFQHSPELVLLSSEPFPFRAKHIVECKAFFPNAHIELVDGEMFSWYGSRLILAPEYFSRCILQWNNIP